MHLILILDGFGYDVVKKYKEAGGFKKFHDPSAVVAPYPSMTDLCIEDLVGGEPCEALEARYFDRKANRVKGGKLAYLLGQNQPYLAKLDYRATSWVDALCYVAPWRAFRLEIKRLKKIFCHSFESRDDKQISFVAYLVTTAGIGTKYGAAGQNMCLGHIEALCSDLAAAKPGLRITLVSDHGHGYVRSYPFDINRELKNLGWRPRSRLEKENDVVYPAFGLVHCAGFHTRKTDRLAQDLASLPCSELTTYKEAGKIVILAKNSRGYAWPSATGFVYHNDHGDPLDLGLPEGGELEMSGDEWLSKSLMHHYPCAPQRLWRAHTNLVQNTPDVILAVKDGYFFGSRLLSKFAHIESTHGGLNQTNSLAFILDTAHIPGNPVFSRSALALAPDY